MLSHGLQNCGVGVGSGLIPAAVIQYVDLVLGLCFQRNVAQLLAALLTS